ncbi:P-loop containing nucleoside triphosphate hydrolase protein [Astrocystis sublimbata]|nr:P-loop containing nucleoside triphosphate hydrolase protein [Astrocystis sublimbata]
MAPQGELIRFMKVSTYGVIYMGTPHQGGNGVPLGRALVNVASIFIKANDRILKHLEKDSEWLLHQLRQYSQISNDFVTKFAYETYETPTALGHKILVVPPASAIVPGQTNAEPLAMGADHRNMVRFSGPKSSDYIIISETLQIMAMDARKNIRSRWKRETLIDSAIISIPRYKHFTGRTGILEELKKKLFVTKECQKLAIVGLGGVGKTQIALQLAYWAKGTQFDYSVFWVPSQSDDSFQEAYTNMSRRLDIQIEPDEDVGESVRRYLESERSGKWLLVVDSADDKETLLGSSAKPGGIGSYLPSSENGLTVFTTQTREVAVAIAGKDLIYLDEMNTEEATELLRKTIFDKTQLQDDATVQELLEELTNLPLAITQAVAYINQTRLPLRKYLDLLQGTQENFVSTMNQGPKNALERMWVLSFSQIRRTSTFAADLVSFISCIEPGAIPRSILPSPPEEEEREHALGTLCRYGFLVRRGDEDTFDMHGHTHKAARIWLQDHSLIERTDAWAIKHLESIFPFAYRGSRLLWRKYMPHAQHALQVSQTYQDKKRFDLFCRVGRCLSMDHQFKKAIIALEETCRWRERYPEEDPDRLYSERSLASAYLNNRQVKEATRILEHVVAIQRKSFAEENHIRLASEHELAGAYINSNCRIKEAIEILEHVVAIRKEMLTEGDIYRLESERELARAYLKNQQIKKASEILEHVVGIEQGLIEMSDKYRRVSLDLLKEVYGMQQAKTGV